MVNRVSYSLSQSCNPPSGMRLNPRVTERSLRQHPAVIKAFTGLPAEAFWDLIEKTKEQLPAYEAQRLGRGGRQRALGGGRGLGQPAVLRGARGLSYLPLYLPPGGGPQRFRAPPAGLRGR